MFLEGHGKLEFVSVVVSIFSFFLSFFLSFFFLNLQCLRGLSVAKK